jgi:hypothetical protein
MLRKRFIQVSLLITLMAISHTGFAQDSDAFYVIPIPVPTDQVVIKEVCNGTPVGNVAFTIMDVNLYYRDSISFGDVFSITSGHLVEIVGASFEFVASSTEVEFRAAPSTLSSPDEGAKGPFYTVGKGDIAFARFL